jgi:hypothetical protein
MKFIKIKEIFGRKQVKHSLLVISIIGFLFCIFLMLPQIQNLIIKIVETNMLHRKLENPNKWKDLLTSLGYILTVFCVIVWYFFIKRKFIASSFFLLTVFGIYLYKLFSVNHEWSYLFLYPFFVLLFVIVVHVVVNRRYFIHMINRLKSILLRLPENKRLKNINHYLVENRFLKSSFFVFICGGMLGSLFFLYIFGTAILDFTYTDWLMKGGDLSQHYLGWKLFRNSSWHFPLGLMDNIVYPFKVSIIYTDSIPLFAIFFKLLSPVLPENFQYFGLFGIFCYTLQGGIGALVVRKIGGNTGQSIIGSLFFILSTVMMWRIYGHTSLSAHFIILLCILAYLQNNNSSLKKQVFIWNGLLVLSASIHLYFVPMVMVFMFFHLLRECIITKNIKNQCIIFGVSVLVLTGTMFCLGVFYFVKDASAGLFGEASANINAFINPQGISRYIKDMPLATRWQYEGNAYLGLGIILFVVGIIFQLCQKKSDLPIVKKEKVLPVLGIVLLFLLFSLSPTITFNQYKLFTYPVLPPIEYLGSIFRSTGRMTWPIIYIIMTACIWRAIKQFSAKKAILFLSVFLLIQWFDLSPWFISKGNNYKTKVIWQTELPSPVWDNLANEYKHIFFMGNWTKLYSFLDLATKHGMTVNDAYLARKNPRMINDNKQREAEHLISSGARDDTVYVFENELQAYLLFTNGMQFYSIDGVTIGLSKADIGISSINFPPKSPSIIPYQKYNNEVLKNKSGFFEIYKGGVLYGPYIKLMPDGYTLNIDCEFDDSLGNPELRITDNFGGILLQVAPLSKGENFISFTLNEPHDNIEFVIYNENFPKIEVKNMFLYKEFAF